MKVDMSPHAVTVRLTRVSQLRRLCLALGKAKPVQPVLERRLTTNQQPATSNIATPREHDD
jgi:hypothetical protein